MASIGPELALLVVFNGGVAIGAARASLLQGIRDTCAMAAAQPLLGFSYAHACKLVGAMIAMFAAPRAAPNRGASHGGGARLTYDGHALLAAFRRRTTRASQQGRTDFLVIAEAARHAGQREI